MSMRAVVCRGRTPLPLIRAIDAGLASWENVDAGADEARRDVVTGPDVASPRMGIVDEVRLLPLVSFDVSLLRRWFGRALLMLWWLTRGGRAAFPPSVVKPWKVDVGGVNEDETGRGRLPVSVWSTGVADS